MTYSFTTGELKTLLTTAAEMGAEKALKKASAASGWVSEETMMVKFDKTKRQLQHLRDKYPDIYRYRPSRGDKVSKDGKTIRRGIEYNLNAYNELFTTPTT